MPSSIQVQKTITVGKSSTIESPSPCTHYSVVFEDDGKTGYFYGLDKSKGDDPICDALQVYNVAAVADRDTPSVVQIAWSHDGLKAVLVINRYPHAIFDFQAKRAYCRTNFPAPDRRWTAFGHEWEDSALNLFK